MVVTDARRPSSLRAEKEKKIRIGHSCARRKHLRASESTCEHLRAPASTCEHHYLLSRRARLDSPKAATTRLISSSNGTNLVLPVRIGISFGSIVESDARPDGCVTVAVSSPFASVESE